MFVHKKVCRLLQVTGLRDEHLTGFLVNLQRVGIFCCINNRKTSGLLLISLIRERVGDRTWITAAVGISK